MLVGQIKPLFSILQSLYLIMCSERISWLKKSLMLTRDEFTVSHKSEYTPHISAINLVYLFKGQYYRNETWIYFRIVNVQLV